MAIDERRGNERTESAEDKEEVKRGRGVGRHNGRIEKESKIENRRG